MHSRTPESRTPPEDPPASPPIQLPPADLGEERDEILRSLELNRQLLHEPNAVLNLAEAIDDAAVQAKIDELLDRLRKTGDPSVAEEQVRRGGAPGRNGR